MGSDASADRDERDGHPAGVPVSRPVDIGEPPLRLLREVLERSRSHGFLGPGQIDVHLANASAFLRALPESGDGSGAPALQVLDLGSGGGLPGLVIATKRADLELLLVDSSERRTTFLAESIGVLDFERRVRVRRGRAEELGRTPELRGGFDVVTVRSFGPPAVTAECAAGFLRGIGSMVLVSEPPGAPDDRWPASGLALLGLRSERVVLDGGGSVRCLVVDEVLDERFPRRVGVPARRPLF